MQLIETLNNGWKLIALHLDDVSPMENHGAMEVAADNENKALYIHDMMLVAYGTESVIKSCQSYAAAR